MSIERLRSSIEEVDDQMLELLQRRARVVLELAEHKRAAGLPPHEPEREARLFKRLTEAATAAGSALPTSSIRAVFREVLSACLSLEQLQRVAYMGPGGTFSHIAARAAFGMAAEYVEYPTIGSVIDAVARDAVRFGVVPIENSTEGGVTATLDGLIDADVMIGRELVIQVPQCLIGSEQDLTKIERVYSHPQPLAQCRTWLARHLPLAELVPSSSTAAAARLAVDDAAAAAIGSRLLAELYGLSVIRENVQDRPENATRFVVLGKSDAAPSGEDKTSLVFTTAHARGALRRALEIFDDEAINLSRIESRPSLSKRWEYVFFTDLEGHRNDEAVARAIERLRAGCSMVKVLGSYPRSDLP